jgi:ADP-heptose:LPS heptosyltransferase
LPEPRRHQVDEYLLLVERIGAAATEREPRLTPPEPDAESRQRVRSLLRQCGAPEGKPWVGVHLGAAYGSAKLWAHARVVEFCRAAPERGLVPVLLGAPSDASVAADVQSEVPVVSLVARDGPELLAPVLAEMAALVAGDTGVAHLAAALGTPVVTLFGPTDPALSAPRGRAAVVRHAVPCAPCFYRTCPIDHPCMRGITADTVGASLDALLRDSA